MISAQEEAAGGKILAALSELPSQHLPPHCFLSILFHLVHVSSQRLPLHPLELFFLLRDELVSDQCKYFITKR
jgi:hypothetical protein